MTMTTITFDTLKFANKLKAAGVPAQQAEAEAASEQRGQVLQYDILKNQQLA
jgi:hypothetical protein